jgi:hypothetical protein
MGCAPEAPGAAGPALARPQQRTYTGAGHHITHYEVTLPSTLVCAAPPQVIDMVTSACTMWLKEYRVDGLRFDSANDLPGHAIQVRPERPGAGRWGDMQDVCSAGECIMCSAAVGGHLLQDHSQSLVTHPCVAGALACAPCRAPTHAALHCEKYRQHHANLT